MNRTTGPLHRVCACAPALQACRRQPESRRRLIDQVVHVRCTCRTVAVPLCKVHRVSPLQGPGHLSYAPEHGSTTEHTTHDALASNQARGERHDFSELGHDRLVIDEKGNERCFSIDRYRWSANLPGIIRSLPSGRRCFFTGHDNWLSIQVLDPKGRNQVYEVYFNVARQSRNFMRLYVESAYVRTEGNEIRQPSDFKREHKLGGKLLLAKKLRGEPIIRPQQR